MARPEIMPCVGCGTQFHPAKTGPAPKYCSRQCKDRQPRERDHIQTRASYKRHYQRNREAILAKNREWFKANPAKPAEYVKAYRDRNPEKIKDAIKEYRVSHKSEIEDRRRAYRASESGRKAERDYRVATRPIGNERSRLWLQAYREAHRYEYREKMRIYCKNNPAKIAAKYHRRRTKQTLAGGSFTAQEWQELLNVTGHKCLCCGMANVKLTVDHVVPVCLGGTSDISNLQPLCKSCNSRKHNKTIDYRCANG